MAMKQVDFAQGSITKNIFQTAMPMLVAQILNLLYNIVDRIYIGRIPNIGTLALGSVGLCFPIITIIMAFANLYSSGGAPLFAIDRGKQDTNHAQKIMNTSFVMLVYTGILLTVILFIFARPILIAFGASKQTLIYSLPYMRIYLIGTIASMISTGMNAFINAEGYPKAGMMTVLIGAVANIILDPLFIFVFGLNVEGAAIATVISQILSALFVVRFLTRSNIEITLHWIQPSAFYRAKDILSLGLAGFIMQLTNGLVQIACNHMLSLTGGDLYVSVMTIVSSGRQMLEIPIWAITDGSSPILSFNYGAKAYSRVKQAFWVMLGLTIVYAGLIWLLIEKIPLFFISIFSNDPVLQAPSRQALHLYFFAFIFMVFQYTGQTMFKSLNRKGFAIFFSLLRKVIIVIPLTILLPHWLGANGVFIAEPISNVVGGLACFITMFCTLWKELTYDDTHRGESK